MKKLLSALLAILPLTTMAQDKPKPYIDAALVSHYMWRGQDLGNVCFQPEIGIGWKGFELSAEGSTGFTRNEFEELDIHLTYNYKGLLVGLSDMWVEDATDSRYFVYRSKETGHTFEGKIGYGCDYGSPFKFFDLDWDFRTGLCPWESSGAVLYYEDHDDKGNEITSNYTAYSYNSGFGINMISLRATKNFPLGKNWKLPVFVELHTNPAAGSARILMGISLATI